MNYEEWKYRFRAARAASRLRYIEARIGRWRTLHEAVACGMWIVVMAGCTCAAWRFLGERAYVAAVADVAVMFGSLPLFERAARGATNRRAVILMREARKVEREKDAEAIREADERGVDGAHGQAAE